LPAERLGLALNDSGATTNSVSGNGVLSMVIEFAFAKDKVRKAIAAAIVSNPL
jgi:hypothetical protein